MFPMFPALFVFCSPQHTPIPYAFLWLFSRSLCVNTRKTVKYAWAIQSLGKLWWRLRQSGERPIESSHSWFLSEVSLRIALELNFVRKKRTIYGATCCSGPNSQTFNGQDPVASDTSTWATHSKQKQHENFRQTSRSPIRVKRCFTGWDVLENPTLLI